MRVFHITRVSRACLVYIKGVFVALNFHITKYLSSISFLVPLYRASAAPLSKTSSMASSPWESYSSSSEKLNSLPSPSSSSVPLFPLAPFLSPFFFFSPCSYFSSSSSSLSGFMNLASFLALSSRYCSNEKPCSKYSMHILVTSFRVAWLLQFINSFLRISDCN